MFLYKIAAERDLVNVFVGKCVILFFSETGLDIVVKGSENSYGGGLCEGNTELDFSVPVPCPLRALPPSAFDIWPKERKNASEIAVP